MIDQGDVVLVDVKAEKAKAAGEAYEKLLADAKAGAQATAQKARDAANSAAEAKRKEVEAETARKWTSSIGAINFGKVNKNNNSSHSYLVPSTVGSRIKITVASKALYL